MTFPVTFHLFGHPIASHPVMEAIGYSGGFAIYRALRRRWPGPVVPAEKNLWLLVGAIFGALFGSKLLAWLESAPEYLRLWRTGDLGSVLGGKTIVGGLLGGWAGVEVAKKLLDIRHSTGDLFVFPLVFGMAVGRVGCFLTGLKDHTCGEHCSLPWAVDFGDGPRHPAQLYDIAFLALLGLALAIRRRSLHYNGELFRLFALGYCAYRGTVEFIKPTGPKHLHLSAIQWACYLAAAWTAWLLYGRPATRRVRAGFPVLTLQH